MNFTTKIFEGKIVEEADKVRDSVLDYSDGNGYVSEMMFIGIAGAILEMVIAVNEQAKNLAPEESKSKKLLDKSRREAFKFIIKRMEGSLK